VPLLTVIYGCFVAENLRICSQTRKAVTIVSSSFSSHEPSATVVKYIAFLLGELHHQVIFTKLADAEEIRLESFYIQSFLRCSKDWNIDDPFTNDSGLTSISIGDSPTFIHLNIF